MTNNKDSYGRDKARGVFCIVPQRAVHDTRLQNRPKTLLCFLAVANYANRAGVAYPNQKTIASDLNITQSTVSRHIKLLMEYGYIRYASKKFNKALSWRSNAYFIVFDETVSEQDAIAVQTAKDWNQIEKESQPVDNLPTKESRMHPETMSHIHSEYISKRELNTVNIDISKNIINEFKKMLETKYGQVIIWKAEDAETVSQWLDNHSKEYILKNIENTLDWRRSKGMDSIKRITYFHKKFMDSKGPKNQKETLDGLLNKFTATHRIKY